MAVLKERDPAGREALLASGAARRAAAALPALAALAVLLYALAELMPVGADFYWWYYRVPQDWWEGTTRLYDESSRQFFSPPWAVWLFLPFAVLEARWAMAAFSIVSMAMVAGVTYSYAGEQGARHPWAITLLVGLCPYTLVMLFTGTPDPWAVLGAFLAYRGLRSRSPLSLGGGTLLALVRPQGTLLMLAALPLGLRGWSRRGLGWAAALPTAVLLLSLAFFGADWPLRWWESYRTLPPSPRWFTSIYTAAPLMGLPAWAPVPAALAIAGAVLYYVRRYGFSPRAMEIALAANAILIPYVRSVSFVVLLALPWAGLAARRPRLAAAAYAVSLPTLFVPVFWERLAVLDLTFPVVLLGLLVLETRLPRREAGDGG